MKNALLVLILVGLLPLGIGHLATDAAAAGIPQDESKALQVIRSVEGNGGNVSGMIASYNTALGLLQQNDINIDGPCMSTSSCTQVAKARAILESISTQPTETGFSSYYSFVVSSVLAASLSAVGVSAAAIFIYRKWKSVLSKRILGMEARREK